MSRLIIYPESNNEEFDYNSILNKKTLRQSQAYRLRLIR